MGLGARQMRHMSRLAVLGLALVSGACGSGEGFRQSVGLSVPPPDEFLVVAREPLQMPPSLDRLPPPQPGAPSLVEPNPQARARQALAGQAAAPAATAAQPSMSELALVASAGPGDPAIRDTLRAEETARPTVRRFGLDSFLGFRIQQDPAAGANAVDPREEAERLRAAGLPVPTAPPAPEAPN